MTPFGGRAALGARVSEWPRVRVAALLLHDGKVVVVRHRSAGNPYHLLPGGGVDYRETLEAAVKREVLEETGFVVNVGELLFVSDTIDPSGPRHVVNITFSAEVVGGSITCSPIDDNVEAVELVSAEALLGLDLRPPMAAEIAGFLAGEATPGYLGPLFTAGR